MPNENAGNLTSLVQFLVISVSVELFSVLWLYHANTLHHLSTTVKVLVSINHKITYTSFCELSDVRWFPHNIQAVMAKIGKN